MKRLLKTVLEYATGAVPSKVGDKSFIAKYYCLITAVVVDVITS